MPNPHPTPPPAPRHAGKAALVAAAAVVFILVSVFVGMNAYHADATRSRQSGQVKPEDKPMTEKDLQKLPAPQR